MFIWKTLHQLYSPGPETIRIPKKLVGGYPYPVLADQTGAVGADTAVSDEQVNINHIPISSRTEYTITSKESLSSGGERIAIPATGALAEPVE
jgi:hypothetical protein